MHGASRILVLVGSAIMILGALAIGSAIAPAAEQAASHRVILRECTRYGLDLEQTLAAQHGDDPATASGATRIKKGWWDYLIIAAALAIFVWLAIGTTRPPLQMNLTWIVVLGSIMLASLLAGGWLLWKKTRFC
jgi:hypothetical protein